jgi:hypothetical protein
MITIRRELMRRRLAPIDHRVAANGGYNRKATTPKIFTGFQGVGRGDSNQYGPRRFADQVFTAQVVGFDSRVVHPHYSIIVKRSF